MGTSFALGASAAFGASPEGTAGTSAAGFAFSSALAGAGAFFASAFTASTTLPPEADYGFCVAM